MDVQSTEKLAVQLEAGQWGKVSPHTVFCCCWLPSGLLLSGSDDGALVTWKHWKAVDKVRAHAKGASIRRADGTPSYNGIRAIRLVNSNRLDRSSVPGNALEHAVQACSRCTTRPVGIAEMQGACDLWWRWIHQDLAD